MISSTLKNLYDQILKDEDFDKLDLGLKNPNIFQILKITNKEIRHSNFLSWLLDPNQSHKLGDIFLKDFYDRSSHLKNLAKLIKLMLKVWIYQK